VSEPISTIEQLVAARQARGVSGEDMLRVLKIAPRQLEALERGDWSALPGTPFVRGVLRAYARALEVDVAPLLDTVGGRVQLRGIGDSLHQMLATSQGRIAFVMPKGTMWARNVQLSELDIGVFVQKMFEDELEDPVQINCGLVAFTVRDGIGAADPILIDTSKNVILGRGGFSFKTERIDMAMRADGKKFSLFSGQSPVGLEGYFAEPAVDPISGELLGRAGAAIGLGAVVSPFAAVISFIDIGDAKAADCGPVLRGAGAKAQRTAKGGPRDDVGRGTTAKSEDGSISDEEAKAQRDRLLRDRG